MISLRVRSKEIHMPRMDNVFSRLKEIVGETHILRDPDRLKDYAVDGKRPKAVLSPGTIEEVSKVVAIANQHSLSIIPVGNRTKMGLGGIPKKADLILSMLRLNRITDSDCDNLTLSAESGITLSQIQKELSKIGRGYFLPLDPPFVEKATLGGIVATNSSGPRRLLYGTVRDLMIGAKAVFPNGDVVASGGKTVKNVSGYDLCKLLIGSYGTLGILCEMTFKLLPLPEREATLLIPFLKLEEAVQFGRHLLRSQYLPASMDILNGKAVKLIHPPMEQQNLYLVAIGLDGVEEAIDRQISEMSEIAKQKGSLQPSVLQSDSHTTFWKAVRDFQATLKQDGQFFISLKSNFLISRCGEVMTQYEQIANQFGMECALICHSGNGVLYSYLWTEKKGRQKSNSLYPFIEQCSSVVRGYEGQLIVESSSPELKKKIDVWGGERSDYEIMRRIKKEIDPQGILNPGRFVGGI